MNEIDSHGADGIVVKLEGRRARKRRETYDRIATEALRLCVALGFERTTIDAIAEAADISRRTFFYYFKSKEDVVFAWKEDFIEYLSEAMSCIQDGISPFDAAEEALIAVSHRYSTEKMIAIELLLHATPSLADRLQGHYAQQEGALFAAMQRKWPGEDLRLRLRVTAATSIAVMRVAAEAWSAAGHSKPLDHYLNQTFSQLRAGALESAAALPPHRTGNLALRP